MSAEQIKRTKRIREAVEEQLEKERLDNIVTRPEAKPSEQPADPVKDENRDNE
jgi:hypothetical protein